MKYIVTGQVTISMHTVVEAESEEEAKDIASERGPCSLIAPEQMGCSEDEVWFHSGEIDGIIEPFEVDVLI